MEKSIKVFDNPSFGKIRTVAIDGELYFVGKDVAMALEYQNGSRDIKRHVDKEDRTKTMIFDGNQNKETIYAMDQYAAACNLSPSGEYDVQWNWGDGVLEDTDKETQIRLQEVNSRIIDKVDYLMWRYGYTEEQAREKIPQTSGFTDYFSGGDGAG